MSPGIAALWNARSVAVVGASDKPGSTGGRVLDYLRRSGFAGRVVPVHPSAESVRGLPARASLTEVEAVDLALLVVPAARIPAALDDCLAAAVPVVIIGASGFAEIGAASAQDELVARAAAAGTRLLGPNCIGAANLHSGLIASFSPYFEAGSPEPTGLAMVSHSGGLGFGIASLAADRGLAPGRIVTTGNEADINAGEVMCELAESDDCTGVLAYLESTPDAKWLDRLHATGKPVAALFARPWVTAPPATATDGVDRAAPAGSPSRERPGANAHDPAHRFDQASSLSRHGVTVAYDVDELLDLASGFAGPAAAGPRVGVVTTSGGAGNLAVEAVVGRRLSLPEPSDETRAALTALLPSYAKIGNPVDVTATVVSDASLLTRTLSIMAADPGFDAVLVCLCVLAGQRTDDVARAIAETGFHGKPVLVSRTGSRALAPDFDSRLARAGVGAYPTPARAVAALAARRIETSAESRRYGCQYSG